MSIELNWSCNNIINLPSTGHYLFLSYVIVGNYWSDKHWYQLGLKKIFFLKKANTGIVSHSWSHYIQNADWISVKKRRRATKRAIKSAAPLSNVARQPNWLVTCACNDVWAALVCPRSVCLPLSSLLYIPSTGRNTFLFHVSMTLIIQHPVNN